MRMRMTSESESENDKARDSDDDDDADADGQRHRAMFALVPGNRWGQPSMGPLAGASPRSSPPSSLKGAV